MSDPVLLGIEIGGTKLQLGLGAGDGRIVALRRLAVAPSAGASGILFQIAGTIDSLLADQGQTRDALAAVGVGFGGPVDAERGLVIRSHQVEGWDGFALAGWVRETLGIARVSVHNDADTAGLGEARFGAGVGRSPILYVTIGSGIGGGLILDGRIYRGSGLGAMEIGHLWIDRPEETERTPEELERIASGWALAREGRALVRAHRDQGWDGGLIVSLVGGDPERVTAEVVARAAEQRDAQALRLLGQASQALARGLAHAATLFAPRRIILGGGVSLIRDDLWIDPIRREVDRLVFPPFRTTFDIVPAALGEDVVVQGALVLARDVLDMS